MPLLPEIPHPLAESAAGALGWPALREHIAALAVSPLGRAFTLALEPCANLPWIDAQQQRTAEIRAFLTGGGSFDFHGLFDPTPLLDTARLEGAALEALDILALLNLIERVAAWSTLLRPASGTASRPWPAIFHLSTPMLDANLAPLLAQLRGKIDPDGSLADDASPELRRIRRAMERQHRAIEESLRKSLARLASEGSTQEDLITVRGERFVIPVKSEFRRRVPGVIHGASSSGQTVFVEPLETIEQNNELIRLLDEEQSEIHRILLAMTRAIGLQAEPIAAGTAILAEVESHFARARFANTLACVRPTFSTPGQEPSSRPEHQTASSSGAEWRDPRISPGAGAPSMPQPHRGISGIAPRSSGLHLLAARHPLLELRLRRSGASPVPLTLALEEDARQLIISGPNTGGKTVSLKTTGLLALMAQAGLPVPAEAAHFPLFASLYADIGDAQSIEQNLSSFSAHIVNVERIARVAGPDSLVLLDELGSATDPEEGAALAVAIAQHFLRTRSWTCITTHLTSLKVYAAQHAAPDLPAPDLPAPDLPATDLTYSDPEQNPSSRPEAQPERRDHRIFSGPPQRSRNRVLNASVGFDQATLSPTYELRLGVPGASAGLNIAERLGLSPAIVADARAQLTTQAADLGALLDSLHDQLSAATTERDRLRLREAELTRERLRLETEGRAEQKARIRELEAKLNTLIADFDAQLREIVQATGDKALAQKIQRSSMTTISRARREFSDQFNSTVVAHTTGADKTDPASPLHSKPATPATIQPGDLVRLKSLGRQARVERVIDPKNFEVSVGNLKMRVPLADIAEVETVKAVSPLEAARKRGNITIQTRHSDEDYLPSEINVIGRTADEAEDEVSRFLDRAFLAGLPRIRVVHGTGMGILRRTLREFLRKHPNVTQVTEPPYNQGGQGATEVELKQ